MNWRTGKTSMGTNKTSLLVYQNIAVNAIFILQRFPVSQLSWPLLETLWQPVGKRKHLHLDLWEQEKVWRAPIEVVRWLQKGCNTYPGQVSSFIKGGEDWGVVVELCAISNLRSLWIIVLYMCRSSVIILTPKDGRNRRSRFMSSVDPLTQLNHRKNLDLWQGDVFLIKASVSEAVLPRWKQHLIS